MRDADRIGGLIIIAFGAGYLLAAISMPSATIGDPLGHKTFPAVLGGLMTFLGLSLLVKTGRDREFPSLKRTLISVILLAGLLGVYGYSIQSLGYPLGTFLFLFITSRLIGERSWTLGLLLSAGLSLGIFILFTKILDIPLPLGILKNLIV